MTRTPMTRTVAIMQPYLLPWIGYFQLMAAADHFLIYDDVTFIKGGYINRNTLLTRQGRQPFTLPVAGISPNRAIADHRLAAGPKKLLRSIEVAYGRAPCFEQIMPILTDALGGPDACPGGDLGAFLARQLRVLADALGLTARPGWQITRSSALADDKAHRDRRAADRVLALTRDLNGDHYVNAPGGRALYDPATFHAAGVRLSFLESTPRPWPQWNSDAPFDPYLSIIDPLMFTGLTGTRARLADYHLDTPSA
ncbi:WbqC family protein [Yunchengibacter salinarum]|uniref:WbqC family protein n=1 Tax=Yunchengibacter salinarum TaxID=3133399 RepID=UPI0035B644B2